ncbi:lactate utilization protein C [Vibrio sp. SCSIO 43136]|uniref:LutC/YkgG family protein n=1 Tax=Vibrio sp. SCSIO 43136 TaxID=2819101 RepID=UPI002075D4AC|nr:lactate utilization protein C [Vibrio sp. SCSIO 43136]USD67212.1 lactate utilization protein C [Vibrio sp. SCSIO 43136]
MNDIFYSRNNILKRLKQAQALAKPVESGIGTIPNTETQLSDEALESFKTKLTANHAEVLVITPESITSTIDNLVERHELKQVITGTHGEYQSQFEQALLHCNHHLFNQTLEEFKSQLFFEIDAGITHSVGGIVDTGAIALWPSQNEPRSLSLVPPCHIVLVKRSSLHANFAGLMAAQNWRSQMPTNIVLVSGPSKTADIQQTLAYGAHGPKKLIVLIIDDLMQGAQ